MKACLLPVIAVLMTANLLSQSSSPAAAAAGQAQVAFVVDGSSVPRELNAKDVHVAEDGVQRESLSIVKVVTSNSPIERYPDLAPNKATNFLKADDSSRRVFIVAFDENDIPDKQRLQLHRAGLSAVSQLLGRGELCTLVVIEGRSITPIHDFATSPDLFFAALSKVGPAAGFDTTQLVPTGWKPRSTPAPAEVEGEASRVSRFLAIAKEKRSSDERPSVVDTNDLFKDFSQLSNMHAGVPGRRMLFWVSGFFPFTVDSAGVLNRELVLNQQTGVLLSPSGGGSFSAPGLPSAADHRDSSNPGSSVALSIQVNNQMKAGGQGQSRYSGSYTYWTPTWVAAPAPDTAIWNSTLHTLVDTGTAVYPVRGAGGLPKGVKEQEVSWQASALAALSGGRVIATPTDISGVHDWDTYYVLTYDPPTTAGQQWRHLAVTSKDGVRLRVPPVSSVAGAGCPMCPLSLTEVQTAFDSPLDLTGVRIVSAYTSEIAPQIGPFSTKRDSSALVGGSYHPKDAGKLLQVQVIVPLDSIGTMPGQPNRFTLDVFVGTEVSEGGLRVMSGDLPLRGKDSSKAVTQTFEVRIRPGNATLGNLYIGDGRSSLHVIVRDRATGKIGSVTFPAIRD